MLEEKLEGKHFVFKHWADYLEDVTYLMVFQVRGGKLEEVWDPYEGIPPEMLSECDEDDPPIDFALVFLKKNGVNEVYTLGNGRRRPIFSPKRFLDRDLEWNNESACGGYDPLDPGEWKRVFKEEGIKLIFYDKYQV